MEAKDREKLKKYIAIIFLIMIVICALVIVVFYQINGEINMPYKISKIIYVSSAEGYEKEGMTDTKWNMSISQLNDIYIFIEKNSEENVDKLIESVKIENIKITKSPKVGNVVSYMPGAGTSTLFKKEDRFAIKDSLEFKGSKENNLGLLQINSKGGNVVFRVSNENIGEYVSNEISEIKHDGTLLKLLEDFNYDDIKFKMSFDLIIKVDGINYKTTISLDLPIDDIRENGTTTHEKENIENIIFKRV